MGENIGLKGNAIINIKAPHSYNALPFITTLGDKSDVFLSNLFQKF